MSGVETLLVNDGAPEDEVAEEGARHQEEETVPEGAAEEGDTDGVGEVEEENELAFFPRNSVPQHRVQVPTPIGLLKGHDLFVQVLV